MKRFLKIAKNLIFIIALVFGLSFATVWLFSVYQRPIPKADAIIILGAAINTPALYNRSMEGLKLYQASKADVLILSGGRISDKDISEAGYMKKVILKETSNYPSLTLPIKGRETKDNLNLILEESSHTTYENLQNSKKLIPNAKSVIIVSDKYHLARGVVTAWSLGFSSVYWSAPNSSYYPKEELYYHYFRETVALLAYVPKLVFR